MKIKSYPIPTPTTPSASIPEARHVTRLKSGVAFLIFSSILFPTVFIAAQKWYKIKLMGCDHRFKK
jgi:hypothetical protein